MGTPIGHRATRARIGLAQALLNDPALVFLDESTSGLDPVGRRLVRDLIHDLRARHDRRPLRWSHRWRGRPAL